jgi:hypothetical protein
MIWKGGFNAHVQMLENIALNIRDKPTDTTQPIVIIKYIFFLEKS